MPRALFSVSYTVRPEKREEYLDYVRRLRGLLRTDDRHYDVFEVKGKKNQFSEILLTPSVEELDTFEDSMDDAARGLLGKIEDCMEKGTTRYSTMLELE
ncbi:MAG: hypothetical protein OEV30_03130 [Ignavibacteria bacterium]|nr:hypothetical protein [Ignavibacteria bacterium]